MEHPFITAGDEFITTRSGEHVTAMENPVHRAAGVWSVAVMDEWGVSRWTSINDTVTPINRIIRSAHEPRGL